MDKKIEDLEKELNSFNSIIPDTVIDYFLEKSGSDINDPKAKKLIALLAQKFMTDVSTSAFQFHKINQKAALKDKRLPREKKPTLQMADLELALDEIGIDIKRPPYFM
ncbi:Transcription initiation factor TFIID subunit 10 [Dictyocoela muelleri]|nr:Transcription initiation factor TFIID subunit 10 [Dictyocoela muelleri]